jgi:elongation factor Ts
MAEITAAMVKELRDKTDVPMMKAKKALVEADGDMEAAITRLREENKNIQLKEGRVSAEGLVEAFVRENGKLGVLIEVNSETDFVARNEEFAALVRFLAHHAGQNASAESVEHILDAIHTETGEPARIRYQEVLGKLRENIVFKRFTAYETTDGTVGSYIHSNGKIGVLVELAGEGVEIDSLAKEIAMQIASQRPKYLSKEEVPANIVEAERDIARANAMADPKNASKPAEILEKIIEGGLSNYYKTAVLLEQAYIREQKQTIAQLIKGKTEVRRFVRYEIGEVSA